MFDVRGVAISAAVACAAAACGGGDDDGLGVAAECNPLGGAGCVTPWPSSIYEVDDAATATGRRLDLAPGSLPTNVDGIQVDPAPFNRRDGWSPAVQIFTAFPGGVDGGNLPGLGDIGASLAADSPTVIVDMETGERVAHFAELDVNAGEDYDEQALYLRPAARLRGGARYAVGIRRSLRARGGGELPMPPGFAAIVDGAETSHDRLERVRPRYDAIFAALEDAGVARDDLVVAWDFTTASDASLTADMLAARDVALDAMGDRAANMSYVVDEDAPVDDGAQIARRVIGTFEMPMLLAGNDGIDGMARAADGTPEVVGTAELRFVAMVPACASSAAPVPIMVFGHGFFGNINEAQGDYMRHVADQLCVVVVGTEWMGMSLADIAGAALALNDGNNTMKFGERIVQGIIGFITLEQLARGSMATDLLVDGGGSIVDPTRVYFYGISQGGILGTTFMAMDPFIERGVIHVGAGNWSLLFERSIHWGQYGTILGGAYPGPLNMVIMEGVLQMGFDLSDPVHVAPGLVDDKQILMQIAVGDSAVSNVASFHQARTMGLPVLGPAVFTPYGLDETAGPAPSAFVMYDEQPEPMPHETNALNEVDNGTHSSVRRRTAVVEQIRGFLFDGEIVHACGEGPCHCTTGACGEVVPPID